MERFFFSSFLHLGNGSALCSEPRTGTVNIDVDSSHSWYFSRTWLLGSSFCCHLLFLSRDIEPARCSMSHPRWCSLEVGMELDGARDLTWSSVVRRARREVRDWIVLGDLAHISKILFSGRLGSARSSTDRCLTRNHGSPKQEQRPSEGSAPGLLSPSEARGLCDPGEHDKEARSPLHALRQLKRLDERP